MGQNFLTSKAIVNEIIQAGAVESDDVILEVGPGKGILTKALLEKAGRVIAVEKDEHLTEFLQKKFADREKLEVVRADILKFNPRNCELKTKSYKIIANIPYYITSHLLRKFLESDCRPSRMVLMVQKEVAERIVARNGKESILSISVKAYGSPRIIKRVPAKYFSPKPKVDSAILLIDNISKDFFSLCGAKKINEEKFFTAVKKGFSSKRKLIKNNLQISDTQCLTKCGIGEKARAEELNVEQWKCLVEGASF